MAVEDDLLRIFQKTENRDGPATERTLRELTDAFKKYYDPSGQLKKTGDAADDAAEGLGGVSEEAENAKKGLEDFKDSINSTIRTINGLVRSGTRVVSGMANVGNSVSSAAQSLDAIPVVGDALATVFGAVASAAEQVVNSFITATGSGATFSGSILELARNAGTAGMTMDQFGQLIKANGDGLLGLASNTAVGARRFSLLSRRILNTSDDLFALGFSTQDLNEGLARYSAQQRFLGRQEQMTDQQLIAGTRRYVKDLDILAKITGEERKAKEAERDALMKDAQFRLGLAGKSQDVVRSFGNLIQSVPSGPLQDFIKDVVTTGAVTSDTNGVIASQMQGTFSMLQQFEQMRRNNIAISDDQMQQFLNTFGEEGRTAIGILGNSGQAANVELREAFNAIADAAQIPRDAFKSAKESQDLAIKSTDNFNTRLQKAQQQVAQLGNFFQVALAQSGMLPHLMNGFLALSSITANVILPAFRLVGDILGATVIPVLQAFSTIASVVIGTVSSVASTMTLFKTVLSPVVKSISTVLTPVLAGLATASAVVATAYAAQKIAILASTAVTAVYTAMTTLLTGGLAGMTFGILGVTVALAPVAAIGLAVAGALAYLYAQGYTFSGALDNAKDNLLLFSTYIGDAYTYFQRMIRSISEAEAEREYAINEDTRKQIAERKAARREEREKLSNERSLNSILKNLAPNYQDLLNLQQKDLDQKEQLLNYNDPVALLTGFAEQQGVADRFEQYGQRSGSEAVETAASGRGARSSTATPTTPTSTTPANPQTRPDGGNLPAKPQYDADGNLIPTGKNINSKTQKGELAEAIAEIKNITTPPIQDLKAPAEIKTPSSTLPSNLQTTNDTSNTNSKKQEVDSVRTNTTTSPVSVDEFSNLDTVGQNSSAEKLDQLNTLVSQLVGYMSETSRNTKSTADRLGNASGDLFSGIGA